MKDLLIVEDDPTLGEGIRLALQAPELRPQLCRSLADAGELLSRRSFDLLILDINLPDGNGLDLLRALRRESEVPVILLTANDLETDIVAGLELGADDYITKPFNPLEVIARVKSQLRRYTALGGAEKAPGLLSVGPISMDDGAKLVTVDGEPVSLTPIEYNILKLLMTHPGQVFSSAQIYEQVWNDPAYGSENTVAVHIRHLREKIEINPAEPRYLKVVWGLGYKMDKGGI